MEDEEAFKFNWPEKKIEDNAEIALVSLLTLRNKVHMNY